MTYQQNRAASPQGDVWSDRFMVGGSDPLQTAGAVSIWLASGNTVTLTHAGSPNYVIAPTVSGRIDFWNSVRTNDSFYASAGSPFNEGVVIPLTTEVIITGGMWVMGSKNDGKVRAALAASSVADASLGVALATAGSNTTVDVLVKGLVYMIAEKNVSGGLPLKMGQGAKRNTVAFNDLTGSPLASTGTV